MGPVQPLPPHCPYKGAASVGVDGAEVAVVVVRPVVTVVGAEVGADVVGAEVDGALVVGAEAVG